MIMSFIISYIISFNRLSSVSQTWQLIDWSAYRDFWSVTPTLCSLGKNSPKWGYQNLLCPFLTFLKTKEILCIKVWERERMGWFGRMALKHVYYHVRNESPVYVRCRMQDAWGWCTGMIWRDDVEWEVGGGFMFGIACTPVADSCQCMAKPIQYVQ